MSTVYITVSQDNELTLFYKNKELTEEVSQSKPYEQDRQVNQSGVI